MSERTKIEWAHDTFNPWWGCVRVSPGCEHCYAESWAKRMGKDVWGTKADRRMMSDNHWKQPAKWNLQAEQSGEPRRVFCGSMCDVFEARSDGVEDTLYFARQRLFNLIEATPHLTWMLLTKRPENMVNLTSHRESWRGAWPRNVWAMCTVEDQQRADERIPHLLQVPAAVLGLSCEPLLGPVDFTEWLGAECRHEGAYTEPDTNALICRECDESALLNWCIAGGESGPKARPMHSDWARGIRDQCDRAGTAFHFKQWGEWVRPSQMDEDLLAGYDFQDHYHAYDRDDPFRLGKKVTGRKLDGRTWDQFPKTEQ